MISYPHINPTVITRPLNYNVCSRRLAARSPTVLSDRVTSTRRLHTPLPLLGPRWGLHYFHPPLSSFPEPRWLRATVWAFITSIHRLLGPRWLKEAAFSLCCFHPTLFVTSSGALLAEGNGVGPSLLSSIASWVLASHREVRLDCVTSTRLQHSSSSPHLEVLLS